MAEVFYEERTRREREAWKQFRWQTMQLLNIAGKYAKREIKETDLFRFSDEVEKIDPEKRKKEALESANYLAKMYPGLIKRGKNGKALICGENN